MNNDLRITFVAAFISRNNLSRRVDGYNYRSILNRSSTMFYFYKVREQIIFVRTSEQYYFKTNARKLFLKRTARLFSKNVREIVVIENNVLNRW